MTPPHAPERSLALLLRSRRTALELTQTAVAERAGIQKSYLSMIENGRVRNPPSAEVLERLEAALEITDGSLRAAGAWQTTPAPIRERVDALEAQAERGRDLADWLLQATAHREDGGRNLDHLFRSGQLTRKLREALGEAQPIDAGPGTPPTVGPRQVPVINKVAAGYPAGFTDLDYPARVADAYTSVFGLEDEDAFAAVVCGDSMLPDYREGDVVVFSPAADVTDGSDCLARLLPDHETTFKRVTIDEAAGTITLEALNPKYPTRTLPREQVVGLYRAVFRQSTV